MAMWSGGPCVSSQRHLSPGGPLKGFKKGYLQVLFSDMTGRLKRGKVKGREPGGGYPSGWPRDQQEVKPGDYLIEEG